MFFYKYNYEFKLKLRCQIHFDEYFGRQVIIPFSLFHKPVKLHFVHAQTVYRTQ